MTTEQNKNLVRRAMAALDARDLDGVLATCAPDATFDGWAPTTLDSAGYRAAMTAILDAFPDSRIIVHDVVAEGDLVACRHTLRGTQRGEIMGVPATGRAVAVPAIVLFRIAGGEARALHLSADMLGMLQQLGAVPAAT